MRRKEIPTRAATAVLFFHDPAASFPEEVEEAEVEELDSEVALDVVNVVEVALVFVSERREVVDPLTVAPVAALDPELVS